jgi:hypothetical protein
MLDDLTMEQQFQLTKIQRSAHELSPEHARELLLEISRLVMLKDNVIKHLVSKNIKTLVTQPLS